MPKQSPQTFRIVSQHKDEGVLNDILLMGILCLKQLRQYVRHFVDVLGFAALGRILA